MQETQDGKIPWRGEWQPIQYSCLENPMVRGSWRVVKHQMWLSERRKHIYNIMWVYVYFPHNYVRWEVVCYTVFNLETQESWWQNSVQVQRQRTSITDVQGQEKTDIQGQEKTDAQLKQRGWTRRSFVFLFYSGPLRIGWCPCTLGRSICLLSSLIQISSRNTQLHPKIMFYQLYLDTV